MRRVTILPVSFLLILAGCGSSSSKSNSPTASTPSTSPPAASTPSSGSAGKSLNVTETEYRLTPASTAVSGGAVQVVVKNSGAVVHALEIGNAGPGGKNLRSADVQPGASTTITANLKPGKTYLWYCPIDGHKGLGMRGTITVSSSAKATVAPSTSQSPSGSRGSGGY